MDTLKAARDAIPTLIILLRLAQDERRRRASETGKRQEGEIAIGNGGLD